MIFVFGSNLAGRHGKGAALLARQKYGAIYCQGEGRQGNSYALPTKDEKLRTRSLEDIEVSIKAFFEYAWNTPEETFLLTPIGCGLAGYSKSDIWPLLKKHGVPHNVVLANTWVNDYVET